MMISPMLVAGTQKPFHRAPTLGGPGETSVRLVARRWPADEIAFNLSRDDLFDSEQFAASGGYVAGLRGQ